MNELDMRRKLVEQLAAGVGAEKAGQAAGYSRRHAFRLAKDEKVMAEVAALRAAGDVATPIGLKKRAMERLAQVLDDDEAADRDVLAAVRLVLDLPPGDTAALGRLDAQEQAEKAGQNAARILKGGKSA